MTICAIYQNVSKLKRKGYGHNMGTWNYLVYLFTLKFMIIFIDALVVKEKIVEKLHYLSHSINFIYLNWEVGNINFWQIWHFDIKDTGWVGL